MRLFVKKIQGSLITLCDGFNKLDPVFLRYTRFAVVEKEVAECLPNNGLIVGTRFCRLHAKNNAKRQSRRSTTLIR